MHVGFPESSQPIDVATTKSDIVTLTWSAIVVEAFVEREEAFEARWPKDLRQALMPMLTKDAYQVAEAIFTAGHFREAFTFGRVPERL